MRLIGMLDSPYVRRVAISLDVLGVPFTHEAVSVFQNFDRFHAVNPVVKAPTLVCDDGDVLMDSSLILQYVEGNLADGRSLWSADAKERQNQFRMVSLALAACDKSVQLIYERNLRPAEFQYEPWLNRVTGQLLAAYDGLEREIQQKPAHWPWEINQAAISAAVGWQLTQSLLAHVVPAVKYPGLVRISEQMEKTPHFLQYPPLGPGVSAP